jgi:hypothetical protein
MTGREPPDEIELFVAAGRRLGAPLSKAERALAWQRLQTSRSARAAVPAWTEALVPRRPLLLGMLALAAVSSAAAWVVVRRMESHTLSFAAEPTTARAADGTFGASGDFGGLRFSDGTRVTMRHEARIALGTVTAKGADLRLQQGIIDVDVKRQPGSHWTFDAGPFTVVVKGTSFSLEWNRAEARGELRMWSGNVVVTRDAQHAPLAVKAGEVAILNASEEPSASGTGNGPPPLTLQSPPEVPAQPAREAATDDENEEARSFKKGSRGHAHAPRPDAWGALIASGGFAEVLAQANRKGVDSVLSHGSPADVAALADAARYLKENELARRALLALRSRFPGTERAKNAAFFLARVGAATDIGTEAVLAWYDSYLREAPSGPYVEGALAQEIILLQQQKSWGRARAVAHRYLSEHPRGVYRELATRAADEPDEP